jgi:hypothetical protein
MKKKKIHNHVLASYSTFYFHMRLDIQNNLFVSSSAIISYVIIIDLCKHELEFFLGDGGFYIRLRNVIITEG